MCAFCACALACACAVVRVRWCVCGVLRAQARTNLKTGLRPTRMDLCAYTLSSPLLSTNTTSGRASRSLTKRDRWLISRDLGSSMPSALVGSAAGRDITVINHTWHMHRRARHARTGVVGRMESPESKLRGVGLTLAAGRLVDPVVGVPRVRPPSKQLLENYRHVTELPDPLAIGSAETQQTIVAHLRMEEWRHHSNLVDGEVTSTAQLAAIITTSRRRPSPPQPSEGRVPESTRADAVSHTLCTGYSLSQRSRTADRVWTQ